MPVKRLTVSDITDDQLDALWDALDLVEIRHAPGGAAEDYDDHRAHCAECGDPVPCPTVQIINRQRTLAMKEHPRG